MSGKKVKKDLTGQKFNKLTVVEDCGRTSCNHVLWLCQCECGNFTKVPSNSLTSKTNSRQTCGGCYQDKWYLHDDGYYVGFTTEGEEFYFSEPHLEKISKHTWCYGDSGYLSARVNGKNIRLHTFIMNTPKGMQVDHINRVRHDCRDENMRICTKNENSFNRNAPSTNTSGYKGVYFDNKINKWAAKIGYENKTIHLGKFEDIQDAANAYNLKAIELFGEYAGLNEI